MWLGASNHNAACIVGHLWLVWSQDLSIYPNLTPKEQSTRWMSQGYSCSCPKLVKSPQLREGSMCDLFGRGYLKTLFLAAFQRALRAIIHLAAWNIAPVTWLLWGILRYLQTENHMNENGSLISGIFYSVVELNHYTSDKTPQTSSISKIGYWQWKVKG